MRSFRPVCLQSLMPSERTRLLALTLPPRHPGDQSVFEQLLRAPKLYVPTLGLVAADGDRWIGWTLTWWRFDESIARIGIFVDRDHRDQGLGSALLRRMTIALDSLGLRTRGNATDEAAARLFERFGIVNDGMAPTGLARQASAQFKRE